MDYFLEFVSTALSVSIVAFGLVLLDRSQGVVQLEILPLATGLTIVMLSVFHSSSASTLHATTLVLPIFVCILLVVFLQPLYLRWRLMIAGESTTLLLSFAAMNCCLLGMSIADDARSLPIGLADYRYVETKARLEVIVILLCMVVLVCTKILLHRSTLLPALQLSRDDHRLLSSFGKKPLHTQRIVLLIATVLCVVGTLLFGCLQDRLSINDTYAVLIPAFAIAISQSRIRLRSLVPIAVALIAFESLLTSMSSELLRDFYQATLFSLIVLLGVLFRAGDVRELIYFRRRKLLRGKIKLGQ